MNVNRMELSIDKTGMRKALNKLGYVIKPNINIFELRNLYFEVVREINPLHYKNCIEMYL